MPSLLELHVDVDEEDVTWDGFDEGLAGFVVEFVDGFAVLAAARRVGTSGCKENQCFP